MEVKARSGLGGGDEAEADEGMGLADPSEWMGGRRVGEAHPPQRAPMQAAGRSMARRRSGWDERDERVRVGERGCTRVSEGIREREWEWSGRESEGERG
jgi:hypothetical protein